MDAARDPRPRERLQPVLRARAVALDGISPRTLSLRLRALEAEGIVERRTYPEVPPRVEYRLTAKGRALVPLIEQMRHYGREWLMNGNGVTEGPRTPDPRSRGAAGPGHKHTA